ncbi:senescence-associated domain-containing protein ASCRUDRAFT_10256 [Ascoidea rubescens DSM 1968]|uniref:Senescence domain-containing protein n=1 Tax=Ascoidea rubescens DSM 1968 TaxID=1344418 RepID=A0A1D2V9Y3_9ASCO|nr:hypothetical protein ASCRUDRAFT_10256 [Ascoidea rubescens DSM 1968]ODV58444.1 hypothetical protein ASCRUDRAFT_10256 [Ascoidea rubescens DSM 1968]
MNNISTKSEKICIIDSVIESSAADDKPSEAIEGQLELSLLYLSSDDINDREISYLYIKFPSNVEVPIPKDSIINNPLNKIYCFQLLELLDHSIKLDFRNVSDEQVEYFESILINHTSFKINKSFQLAPSLPERSLSSFNDEKHLSSANFQERKFTDPNYLNNDESYSQGQLILVDSQTGNQIGKISNVQGNVSSNKLDAPVEIVLPENDSNNYYYTNNQDEQAGQTNKPLYIQPIDPNDKIIYTSTLISNGLIYTSSAVSNALHGAASFYINNSKPADEPVHFDPSTKKRVETFTNITSTGRQISSKAVSIVSSAAHSLGAKLNEKAGERDINKKPGLIKTGLLAFSTILDGTDIALQNLLHGASTSTTRVIDHKYGNEARDISANIGRGVSSCALIYVDVRGISRRAIIKSVGKGAIIGNIGDKKVVLQDSAHVEIQNKSDNNNNSSSSVNLLTNHTNETDNNNNINNNIIINSKSINLSPKDEEDLYSAPKPSKAPELPPRENFDIKKYNQYDYI